MGVEGCPPGGCTGLQVLAERSRSGIEMITKQLQDAVEEAGQCITDLSTATKSMTDAHTELLLTLQDMKSTVTAHTAMVERRLSEGSEIFKAQGDAIGILKTKVALLEANPGMSSAKATGVSGVVSAVVSGLMEYFTR